MKSVYITWLIIFMSANVIAQTKSSSGIKNKRETDSARYAFQTDSIRTALSRDTGKMMLRINAPVGTVSSKNIMIGIDFRNLTKHKIRLLDLFSDVSLTCTLILKCEHNVEYLPLGFGPSILDFPWNAVFKYIDIPAGKSFIKTINLTDVVKLHDGLYLPKGNCRMTIQYGNRYGSDCIVGIFKSREVNVNIVD